VGHEGELVSVGDRVEQLAALRTSEGCGYRRGGMGNFGHLPPTSQQERTHALPDGQVPGLVRTIAGHYMVSRLPVGTGMDQAINHPELHYIAQIVA
jgi:hypothetical protein